MVLTVETIYYLENAEKGITRFATGSQLRYGDIIKEVFGVAQLSDLSMMLQFNKHFQECVSKAHGVNENDLTLDLIFRVATKTDLLRLKKQYDEVNKEADNSETNHESARPFDAVIRLHEGVYKWNAENYSYQMVKTS